MRLPWFCSRCWPGNMRTMIEYADPKLTRIHVADCYNHKANVGNLYLVKPPGLDARVHQHNEIGNGDAGWAETFAALRGVTFDGIAAVCVFGWEEPARRHPPPHARPGDIRARKPSPPVAVTSGLAEREPVEADREAHRRSL
jgi:sugar phosphate isomerase/epimerase